VNAIVAMRDRDELMRRRRRRDDQLARGEYLGWLHGFPFAVKDLAAAEGLLWTEGSPIYADRVADVDELFVRRIKEAGAIVVGKTNVPEFGLGSQTYNRVYGATATPYDTARTAGGSSGGAGRGPGPAPAAGGRRQRLPRLAAQSGRVLQRARVPAVVRTRSPCRGSWRTRRWSGRWGARSTTWPRCSVSSPGRTTAPARPRRATIADARTGLAWHPDRVGR
jgi:hypothetical protein